MKRRNFMPLLVSGFGMLVLILDGKTALLGMQEAVGICLWTVIPALFPFLFLSAILTDNLYGKRIPGMGILNRWCKIPEEVGYLLLIGFLGGYPAGAANAARLWRNGSMDKESAGHLAVICNNAGPAFLFGIVGRRFPSNQFAWLLWLVHIVSNLLVARILPGKPGWVSEIDRQNHKSIPNLLWQTLKTMAAICGWVMLFRLLLTFLERWFFWMLPDEVTVLLSGILELSNGCLALSKIQTVGLRFCMAAFLLGFGGFCVAMQTYSVCEGLQLRGYMRVKLLHGMISMVLAFLIYRFGFVNSLVGALLLVPFFLSFSRKSEKRGSNSTASVV